MKSAKSTKILLLLLAFFLAATVTENYCHSNIYLKKPVVIENWNYSPDIYAENHSRVKQSFLGMVFGYYEFCCTPPRLNSLSVFMEFSTQQDFYTITGSKRGPPVKIHS
jgi:hypothetical protein